MAVANPPHKASRRDPPPRSLTIRIVLRVATELNRHAGRTIAFQLTPKTRKSNA
jgi:hypothetical protein